MRLGNIREIQLKKSSISLGEFKTFININSMNQYFSTSIGKTKSAYANTMTLLRKKMEQIGHSIKETALQIFSKFFRVLGRFQYFSVYGTDF